MNTIRQKLFIFSFLLFGLSGFSQYCTPTTSTGNLYISYLDFGYTSSISGGTSFNTGSNGYTYNSTSQGSIKRDCTGNVWFGLFNNTGSTVNTVMHLFTDNNNDGDFSDAGELANINSYTNLATNSSLGSGISFTVPSNYAFTTMRIRFAMRTTSSTDPCGTYNEVEDYILTISPNAAPTINTAGSPVFNPISETYTSNQGMLISQIIASLKPEASIITESDECQLHALAVVGTTAINGSWEYKVNTGAWTPVGSLSDANALLLFSTAQVESRLRFVPTGSGSGSITVRAWDRTLGSNGTYYNITSTGGSTAFSTSTESISLTTLSSSAVAGGTNIYFNSYGNEFNRYNLVRGSLNLSTSVLTDAGFITSDDLSGYGQDIDYDAVNSKVLWLGGASGADLNRSNPDGSNLETMAPTFGWPTGIAIGNNKIFVGDYGDAIYTMALDGTGKTAITGGAGQGTINNVGDIEYRAGKIYYGNQQVTSPAGNYFLMSANEDGTGTTQLYSTALPIYNIATSSTTLYWTEYNSTSPATSYLKSMPIAGGTVTTMATSTISSFYDLYADETNSQLYFVEALSENRTYNLLRKMPIAGGAASTVYVSESQLYSFTLASSVALPVTFIQVDAQLKGSTVDVKWDVAAEQNVREYSVQKSRNGMNFQETGTVPAEGKPTYRFTDKSPFTGKSYYRILAIDHDGKQTYSRIIPVDMQITSLKIYPTIMRSGEALSLSVTSRSDMQMDVQVYSMAGAPVYKGKVMITKGDNQFKVQLPSMVSGQYLVRLSGGGETIYTTSLSVL